MASGTFGKVHEVYDNFLL